MQQLERITLWTLVILTLLLVILRPNVSGYIGRSISLFQLQEFSSFPPDMIKQISVPWLAVWKAAGDKVTQEYNVMSADQKTQFAAQIQKASDQMVTQITAIPLLTQAAIQSALSKTQGGPTSNDPCPDGMVLVPMSSLPAGVAVSSEYTRANNMYCNKSGATNTTSKYTPYPY